MCDFEDFQKWRQLCFQEDEEQKKKTLDYFTKVMHAFQIDEKGCLVNYRKSRMLDSSGIETEEFIVPDDEVDSYLYTISKYSKSQIRKLAIYELKNEERNVFV